VAVASFGAGDVASVFVGKGPLENVSGRRAGSIEDGVKLRGFRLVAVPRGENGLADAVVVMLLACELPLCCVREPRLPVNCLGFR